MQNRQEKIRQIIYRATHRSMREADLTYGEFVKNTINQLDDLTINTLEKTISYHDDLILDYIKSPELIIDDAERLLFERMHAFCYGQQHKSS